MVEVTVLDPKGESMIAWENRGTQRRVLALIARYNRAIEMRDTVVLAQLYRRIGEAHEDIDRALRGAGRAAL